MIFFAKSPATHVLIVITPPNEEKRRIFPERLLIFINPIPGGIQVTEGDTEILDVRNPDPYPEAVCAVFALPNVDCSHLSPGEVKKFNFFLDKNSKFDIYACMEREAPLLRFGEGRGGGVLTNPKRALHPSHERSLCSTK
jgi:hypothetical protein